jgi:hypothetical protein
MFFPKPRSTMAWSSSEKSMGLCSSPRTALGSQVYRQGKLSSPEMRYDVSAVMCVTAKGVIMGPEPGSVETDEIAPGRVVRSHASNRHYGAGKLSPTERDVTALLWLQGLFLTDCVRGSCS